MEDIFLVTGSNVVKIWNTNDSNDPVKLNTIEELALHKGRSSISISWSADNKFLAGCSPSDEQITIRRLDANKDFIISGEECVGKTCVSFDSSNNLYAGGKNGIIHFWDPSYKKVKYTYKPTNSCVTALHHSNADSTLASGFDNGSIAIYTKQMGSFQPIPSSNKLKVSCLRFNYVRTEILASASIEGCICMFDVNRKEETSLLSCHSAPATSLAFSPINDKLMLSGGLDKTITIYDTFSKSKVKDITCPEPVESIDIHDNGSIVAVGTSKGKIFFYDLRKNQKPINIVTGHNSPVQFLRFKHEEKKSKSKPKTPKDVSEPEVVQHPVTMMDASSSINSGCDIFSPCRNDVFESSRLESSKPSIGRLMADSLVASEPSLLKSGISGTGQLHKALMFSPIGTAPKSQYSMDTPSRLDGSFNQGISNVGHSTEDEGINYAESSLNSADVFAKDLKNKSISLHYEKSLESISRKVENGGVGAAGLVNAPVGHFPVDLLRMIVKDEVEDSVERLHKGLLNLHVEMIKKFQEQQSLIQHLLEHVSREPQLLSEIRQLREENIKLKEHFK